MRERGLKYGSDGSIQDVLVVAPYAGAWIEIFSPPLYNRKSNRRSLCGSVD